MSDPLPPNAFAGLERCTNAELVKRLGDQRGYYPVLNEALTRLELTPEYRRVDTQHVSCTTSGGVK
jgi:hypothetical protein